MAGSSGVKRMVPLSAVLLALSGAPGHAEMIGDANVADTILVDGQALHRNGAGLRQVRVLGIEIYVAALYLPAPSHDPVATHRHPNRLRVLSKGRVIGDYADGALSHQLLLGFLGEHPPTERLKRQMLGIAEE